MRHKTLSIIAGAAGFVLATSCALAAGSGWPGDAGRPGDGIEPLNDPGTIDPQPPIPRAPDIDYAVKTAQSIVTVCKKYRIGVTVVNAQGEPVLIYIPNGSDPGHAFFALRKALTAVTFKSNTSALVSKGQHDQQFAAKIRANPNLIAYSGAVLVKSGDDIVGAIAVSGAEPGHHDEECALKGIAMAKRN